MNPRTATKVQWLTAIVVLILIALIVVARGQADRHRAALRSEADALWQSLGVSSWSEVEDSDVDLPEVQRLLAIEDELKR
jgi:hypothetical protein